MNFKAAQLESFCRNPSPEVKCIILFGNNEGAISIWQKKCAEAVCGSIDDAFRCTILEMENISRDGQEIYAEYHAQSLMGGRRAVVVKNIDNTLAAFLKSMIPDTSSDSLLVLTSTTLNTKSSLVIWAKDRKDVVIAGCYEEREENISESAAAMLKAAGLYADAATMQVLSARLSPDGKVNQSEIDKLAMYLGERRNVTIPDVLAAVSDVAGADFEDLCYYVAGGEERKACAVYGRLLKEGVEPASIVRQVAYHFGRLLNSFAGIESGKSADEVMKSLRPPLMFYRKTAFARQLRLWNRERTLGALSLLYDCERDCKTTNIPAEQCAGYALLRLCSAVKKFR